MQNFTITTPWGEKSIRVFCGNVTALEQADLLVCSAFRGDYMPTPTSLIGALYRERCISVADLAKAPALNLKDLGVWISAPLIGQPFGRIACVEILSRFRQEITENELRSLYDTLFFAVKKCTALGISIRSVALPVLGAGNQRIAFEKSLVPLLTECMSALRTVEELETVTLFERNEERCDVISRRIRESLKTTGSRMAFISYSHRDQETADLLANGLEENGIKPWIDHRMIRNDDYAEDIVNGISASSAFLLLVSPWSMQSADVLREVRNACTISDSGELKIIPLMLERVSYPPKFSYYLAGLDFKDISGEPRGDKVLSLCRSLRQEFC